MPGAFWALAEAANRDNRARRAAGTHRCSAVVTSLFTRAAHFLHRAQDLAVLEPDHDRLQGFADVRPAARGSNPVTGAHRATGFRFAASCRESMLLLAESSRSHVISRYFCAKGFRRRARTTVRGIRREEARARYDAGQAVSRAARSGERAAHGAGIGLPRRRRNGLPELRRNRRAAGAE